MNSPSSTDTLSHYRLVEVLGRGAMGEVWLAQDTQLPRKVAIKILPAHLTEDREAVDRMLREAQVAASVDHPGVVTVYSAGINEGRPYIVMQRLEGETLEARLKRGPLPVDEAVALASRLADALSEVHALGIVHRDLKPANVVMTEHGPKILDFGVAGVKGAATRITGTGTAVGTPLTMSPEQVKGLPPDNRSDLWGLGVILYEMLTGETPFKGDNVEAVIYQLVNEQPPPPSERRPDVSRDLDYTVMKLLRKDPAHRYARAEDLLADLAICGTKGEVSPEPDATRAPRLAVMYFEVLSADPDDAYLAAGLTEDLIIDLTRVEGLQVAARSEVAPFRDRVVPPRTLGRELAAEYILQGSVRRAGPRARISAQLMRASDGHSIWAERFDRTIEDLFDVQAEVSMRIVEALQVALKPGEREMLDRAPTKSPEAYSFYLKAREQLDLRSRDANFRAAQMLERAIELDPKFALAYSAIGECAAMRALFWWAGHEVADEALANANRALELEPGLLEGDLVRAFVYRIKGEWQKALDALSQVLAINPIHPEALEFAAWCHLSLGQPAEARPFIERYIEHHPDLYAIHILSGACYEMLGLEEEGARVNKLGMECILETVRKFPENVHARSLLASNLVREGQVEAGLEQCRRTIEMAPEDGRILYNAACTYSRLDMIEDGMEHLKKAIKNVPQYIADWPLRDPDMASLRKHPDFVRMFGEAPKDD